ncbi:hypothetical protein FGO68_gene594 [Halteria grandinella]|uniref:Uncharacterized protein n=1 Tax=Halteria grandinella TaxID=5974 RepID=A0A8J8NX08_HALGN|nr:hypothetical protein FGO68_gene594 [Halteria grandinella]
MNCNVSFPISDTQTLSLNTNNQELAVLALNNCTNLAKLEIEQFWRCSYQALAVKNLCLQELTIRYNNGDNSKNLISDILNKCKDTLRSLNCPTKIDLSPLRNSKQLKQLNIGGNINQANLEVIMTFENLEDLKILIDNEIIDLFKLSQTLKTLRLMSVKNGEQILILPESVTTVQLDYWNDKFELIQEFLEQNPFVLELNVSLYYKHYVAYLLDSFKHLKFNFIDSRKRLSRFFTFNQSYLFIHPEIKQIAIPASERDHLVYELLFQRLSDKRQVYRPYYKDVDNYESEDIQTLEQSPDKMQNQLSSFHEFKQILPILNGKQSIGGSAFYKIFNKQIVQSSDYEYLHIIVSAYDEVFRLGTNIDQTVTILKGMSEQERKSIKRERFFAHCKQQWKSPLTPEDFYKRGR